MDVPTDMALGIRGMSKVFDGERALAGVDLDVRRGEIHALLGANGSGKSTLIKILAGYHQPERGGTALLYGESMALGGHAPAPTAPVRFIHQDRGLIGDFTVVDNLALIAGYRGRLWLRERQEVAATRRFLVEHGVDIDVTVPVKTLSAATQTLVAILRAVKHVPGQEFLLVVDEATAALPAEEVNLLFDLLRGIRGRGGSVLYVTHRLGEVFEIADRVTVLRDGRRVGTDDVATLNHDQLVERIVGQAAQAFYPERKGSREGVVLEVQHLSGPPCRDISLRVYAGEVVGVTGLVGSGYETLLSLIFGGAERRSGTVAIDGKPVASATPSASLAAGLAFAPSDRKTLSAIPSWTLAENITLPSLSPQGRWLPWLGDRAERRDAQPWLDQLAVEPRDPSTLLSALSGGNQQRAVIARWIRHGFRALMLEDPTMGVDVGAKPAIYEGLTSATRGGACVVMTTSDVEEAVAVCDRVIVLAEGRVAAILEGDELTVERVLTTSMSVPAYDLLGATK